MVSPELPVDRSPFASPVTAPEQLAIDPSIAPGAASMPPSTVLLLHALAVAVEAAVIRADAVEAAVAAAFNPAVPRAASAPGDGT